MPMDDNDLRELLISAFVLIRIRYLEYAVVLNEVSALRETVLEIGGQQAVDHFEKHKKELANRTAEVEAMNIALLNEIIRRLKEGQV